jgi:FtsH-binding integral membrane protein
MQYPNQMPQPPPNYPNQVPPQYSNVPSYPPAGQNDPFNQNNNMNNPNMPYQPSTDPFLGTDPHTFSDVSIRNGFVRKVYSIISLQMLVTASIVLMVISIESLKGFFIQNSWILWLFMIGTLIVMIVLACCESVARKHPINIILLMVFTVMESFLIGVISTRYKTDTILIAVGITAALVIGITIFAFQTKIDFTGMGIYLFVAVLLLMVFGIFAIIFRSKIMHVVYAGLGAGIFSFYLVFDTQLMLGGKYNKLKM